jgi:hypothetical protein
MADVIETLIPCEAIEIDEKTYFAAQRNGATPLEAAKLATIKTEDNR